MTVTKQRKPVRILRNVRVDEISAVDAGAGEGVRIMLRKRDRTMPDFYKVFGAKKPKDFGGYPTPGMRKNLDVPVDPDGPINPGGDYRPEANDRTQRLSEDADADDDRVGDEDDDENERDDDEDTSVIDKQKEQQMKDPLKKLKSLDAIAICKTMTSEGRAFGLSEHELVDLISKHAERNGTTFANLFSANDDTGLALRKAVDICKQAQFLSRTATLSKQQSSSAHFLAGDQAYDTPPAPGRATLAPRVAGGAAAQNVGNPRSALDDLQKLVDQQRAANPDLSEAQAWSRVYEDPTNKDLVSRERAQNRPTAGW